MVYQLNIAASQTFPKFRALKQCPFTAYNSVSQDVLEGLGSKWFIYAPHLVELTHAATLPGAGRGSGIQGGPSPKVGALVLPVSWIALVPLHLAFLITWTLLPSGWFEVPYIVAQSSREATRILHV